MVMWSMFGPGSRRFRPAISVALVLVLVLTSSLGALNLASDRARGPSNYDFSVERELVDVSIKKDGSVDIDYTFDFTNYGYLDGVDIGLPNGYYDAGSAYASIRVGGQSFSPSSISKSPYIANGLAVEFTPTTISYISYSGTSFTLQFHVNNPHMVYLNELKEGTAGIRFRPTWFSSEYQRGFTNELRARIFFPEGFTNVSEAVYLQDQPWDNITFDSSRGLVVAAWTWNSDWLFT